MINSNELIQKLTKDVNRLQNKIEHRKLYNIRNNVVRLLLKSGVAIDYAFPFIIAAIIIGESQASKGNAPFHIDLISEKASIETIDTSNGMHLERTSYDFNYNDELIEYSTGWIVNEKGLYERTVTSYRLNDEIDLEDTKKVMSMTKEEIDQLLVITNVRTIKKNVLNPDDSIYSSEAIVVINHSESEIETFTRLETFGENVFSSVLYIILVLCWGNSVRNIEKIYVKTYIRDILVGYEHFFRKITEEELENMKKILKVKQENLAMLNSETKNVNEENGYSYKLRKL